MRSRLVGAALVALVAGQVAIVEAADAVDFARVPPPQGLLAPRSSTTAAALVSFLEGPAFDSSGDLYFSDIIGNRILRMSPQGVVSTFRADSGRTNGNTFDSLGRLISCEGAERGPGGRRRIVSTNVQTGEITVLTDQYQEKRYNSPNDVVADADGRVWFTDPFYGDDRSSLEMKDESVYRIDPGGEVTRVLSQPEIERPNGLALTPDGKTLYVVDSHARPGGNRKIWAFDISENGTPSQRRLVFDFGKGRGGDGIRLDLRGNLWVAAGINQPRNAGETAEVPAGVYVISPRGRLVGRIPIPEDVATNLAFGGADRKTLFVTAGKTIYKVPLSVTGYALYPPLKP